jgi:hypothetical protein
MFYKSALLSHNTLLDLVSSSFPTKRNNPSRPGNCKGRLLHSHQSVNIRMYKDYESLGLELGPTNMQNDLTKLSVSNYDTIPI